ncbi:NAD(P)/FAD-dependent oxidoreductase [Burkholderia stagnalis]|uniref:NAD(P)/FAD-dependent oxidoreductase n=1 Tax=Burkholderia stagnalis TaxID=1503054 RepID=UPI000754787A|nr:FAD-binding oxidoreductase [Burkholderia stagnalis]KVO53861.1 FAD-dependent oxidoreductase [Burkholderia stagnalis]KVP07704.1 FAD-dependent oxidoreductase [Burkholderia stagnalis]KVW89966.1 FAD-dependent oxidoreductase [Burkholderia stagnalis]KWH66865.1 FAD-dependent oxidoreductase [Burkholderia stagnalis]KWK17043.1 FAD-dependent oxidoreductase [Burkholderia stagnalis]
MFLQSDRHVASYYAGTHPEPILHRLQLDARVDADVLVVGAGFSGLHTALRLALAGKRVVVLEASRVAWAASGRNGGQALLGWSCDMPPIEAALGRDGAHELWDSMRWAAAEVCELPTRHGFDIDYRPGSLWAAVRPRRVAMLTQARDEAAERWGYERLRVIPRTEMPEWIGSARYVAALYDPEAGHLNPLKLALGLAQTIERAGGRIFEQSRVLDYRETNGGYVARTAGGEVRADVLVLACNAYVDRLDAELARRLLPVGTYQVATAPLDPDVARALLPHDTCVIDNQFVPDYFRLSPDRRLLFGGGCTYLGGIPADIAAATRPHLERVFPQLRGVPLDFAWGGHIDISMRRTPDVGRHGQRYWLQGFSGHGVLPTLAGARAVADAVLGDDRLLALYQRIRNPRFPGGDRLAAPLEAIGKVWYRLRDTV